jgi:hypothetical protein
MRLTIGCNSYVIISITGGFYDNCSSTRPDSPCWNEEAFLQTIDHLKKIDYTSLSLGHFGCLTGDEAKQFPDESLFTYRQWMRLFAENIERIDDISFLSDLMWKRIYTPIPEEFRALLLPGLEGAVGLAARTYKTNRS